MDEVVGNVTTWLRRWVNGALEHQHAPLPQDEFDGEMPPRGHDQPYRYTASTNDDRPWWSQFVPAELQDGGHQYAPARQHDTDFTLAEDERMQIEEAMRRSKDQERGGYGDNSYGSMGGVVDDDEDEEDRDLRRAIELSKEEERVRREAEEAEAAAAAAAASARPPAPLPDLMDLGEEQPQQQQQLGDLLDLGQTAIDGSSQDNALALFDQVRNDEAIARELQGELNLMEGDAGPSDADLLAKINAAAPPPPSIPNDLGLLGGGGGLTPMSGALVPVTSPKPLTTSSNSGSLCGGCGRSIAFGRFLTCLGKSWHPQCFKCLHCKAVISDTEFKAQGSDPLHSECYRQLYHPKCAVCHDYIPVKEGGLIEFRSLPFWGDKYCPAHDSDATPRCTSCHRLEPHSTPYIPLEDGRQLCLMCVEAAVADTNEGLPLMLQVREFFSGLGLGGGDFGSSEIPLLLVETQALNAAREGEKQDGHTETAETRGLCLSEEQTIEMVYRLPGSSSKGLLRGSSSSSNSAFGRQTRTLKRHCEVTAILVLYGLPQLLTGSILAHELMHAWIKLEGGFPSLTPLVEEGLCQAMAHLWLQSQQEQSTTSSSSATPSEIAEYHAKFAEFCMHEIANNSSPVYGEGFRLAHIAVVQHGLKQTLEHVKLTGTFPAA